MCRQFCFVGSSPQSSRKLPERSARRRAPDVNAKVKVDERAFVVETTVSVADMMAELGYVPLGPCHGPESDGRCVDGADERASARQRVSFS